MKTFNKIICTDHYDEEKEKEHDANWSFIVLVTQRVTSSLVGYINQIYYFQLSNYAILTIVLKLEQKLGDILWIYL